MLGWGLGLKEVDGRPTSTIAWRAYVARKAKLDDLPPDYRVPSMIGGLPTDVVERATSRLAWRRNGALLPGTRLVNRSGVPGTLGGRAWCKATGEQVLISSWHVLFGEGGAIGDRVFVVEAGASPPAYKPVGRICGGTLGITSYDGANFHVDIGIAICEPKPGILSARTASKVAARKAAWAKPGALVRKRGAGSGTTSGIVLDIAYPDVAVIEGHAMPAVRQLLVRTNESETAPCFAGPGDSGALLIDSEDRAIGVLWGSNVRGEGIACHLIPALASLNVSLSSPRSDWRGSLWRPQNVHRS